MNSICGAVAVPAAKEVAEGCAHRRAVKPNQRANEAAKALARLTGALDIPASPAGIQQHLFEFAQVGRRERFTLPQLMQDDVVFMGFEEMPRLLLEAGEVGFADLRQFVFDALADLVSKVRIDNRLSRLFDVLDKIAQTQSNEFEQRNGDAFPPLIGLNLFDQHGLMRDRGNAGLRLQRRSDLHQLLLQRVEALRALQQRQLQREHQQVEAFCFLGPEALADGSGATSLTSSSRFSSSMPSRRRVRDIFRPPGGAGGR